MNQVQLEAYLRQKNIPCEGNERARSNLRQCNRINFFLTASGVGYRIGSLLPELLFGKYNLNYFRLYALRSFLFSNKERLPDERYLLIHNIWSGGYSHWLTEALLKVVVSDIDTTKYTLLLPASYKPFALQSLGKFQFRRIHFLPSHHTFLVRKALVIENPVSGFYDKQHIDRMRKLYTSPKGKPHRKIYISRRSEKLRVIENEEVIYPLLEKHGYEIVETQLLGFDEQARLFSEAAVCISIHGAALTNLLFMQPGATLVELYRPLTENDKMNLCYYRLAQASSIRYFCEFLRFGQRVQKDLDRSDLLIDAAAFETLLEDIEKN